MTLKIYVPFGSPCAFLYAEIYFFASLAASASSKSPAPYYLLFKTKFLVVSAAGPYVPYGPL